VATGNSVSFGLSSAQTELYKKTNTDVMTAFKDFTEEYGWADDTPDIRITASANEMRLVIDVNKEVGVANIAEGGYEAIASSVSAENGTLTPIQMNARFSFSTLYKKGWDGSGAKGGQIENEVRFKALKKTQALARVFSQQFYGYSSATIAVVAATQGAGAAQADLAGRRHHLHYVAGVVVALRHFLAGLGAGHGIAHEEHAHLLIGLLRERLGETQAVVTAFGAVGWVVEDEQGRGHVTCPRS
jgi:hypothetical protein